MPKVFADLLTSKRFVVLAAGVLTALAAKYGLSIDTESLAVILTPLVAYILGQSHIDANQPPTPPAPPAE